MEIYKNNKYSAIADKSTGRCVCTSVEEIIINSLRSKASIIFAYMKLRGRSVLKLGRM